ncbi:RNA 2',3'-cyclic phosphodiesterase [Salibacterium salarium]|uniref:RNA 2',3'-cyclic phosphodiesterase n=1 Tax=Salibacterium salarium TaxID=284579 RepID=A0A3R9PMS3_9BACI|nr:RNA 2',3'-cyclic phosphodiesterase [Salibacterium salarium]RSL34226.1 RNA 2',3'-cyclic phosphodiesterase [Salibacterium salarium]
MDSHYFLALPLPVEEKRRITRWKEEAKPYLSFKKWVHEKDYHITLFFLGSMNSHQVKKISEAMSNIAAIASPFIISGGGVGYFGRADTPKVCWVGSRLTPRLAEIQAQISAKCVEHGFNEEKRQYRPHITIARKWTGDNSFQKQWENVPELYDFDWEIDHFVLYKTHLNQEPKYEVLERFSFGG